MVTRGMCAHLESRVEHLRVSVSASLVVDFSVVDDGAVGTRNVGGDVHDLVCIGG